MENSNIDFKAVLKSWIILQIRKKFKMSPNQVKAFEKSCWYAKITTFSSYFSNVCEQKYWIQIAQYILLPYFYSCINSHSVSLLTSVEIRNMLLVNFLNYLSTHWRNRTECFPICCILSSVQGRNTPFYTCRLSTLQKKWEVLLTVKQQNKNLRYL